MQDHKGYKSAESVLGGEYAMKSNWNIKSNVVGGERYYQCYRLKDTSETVHSGNMIEDGELFTSKEAAARRCRALNDELVAECQYGGLH